MIRRDHSHGGSPACDSGPWIASNGEEIGDLKFDKFYLECKHVLHCFNPNTNKL